MRTLRRIVNLTYAIVMSIAFVSILVMYMLGLIVDEYYFYWAAGTASVITCCFILVLAAEMAIKDFKKDKKNKEHIRGKVQGKN